MDTSYDNKFAFAVKIYDANLSTKLLTHFPGN